MKADEIRNNTIMPQYEYICNAIVETAKEGYTGVRVLKGDTILEEVAKMLAKDGFDVTVVYGKYNEVSWALAKEGREGNVVYMEDDSTDGQSNDEDDITRKQLLNCLMSYLEGYLYGDEFDEDYEDHIPS